MFFSFDDDSKFFFDHMKYVSSLADRLAWERATSYSGCIGLDYSNRPLRSVNTPLNLVLLKVMWIRTAINVQHDWIRAFHEH